jgi:putative ABC transport system substrate-binding protein
LVAKFFDLMPCPFRKFHPAWIGVMGENHINLGDVCDLARARAVRAFAAKRATSSIPVVFAVGNDPVEMGLVEALNRPNGNVTGVSFFTTLVGKRLELMRELTSPSATIAYLQDSNNPAAMLELKEFQTTARTIGQPTAIITVNSEADLETAFATAKDIGNDRCRWEF